MLLILRQWSLRQSKIGAVISNSFYVVLSQILAPKSNCIKIGPKTQLKIFTVAWLALVDQLGWSKNSHFKNSCFNHILCCSFPNNKFHLNLMKNTEDLPKLNYQSQNNLHDIIGPGITFTIASINVNVWPILTTNLHTYIKL